ncbi:MAG: AMP-binding protein [Myxococcota bacterium]
MTQLFPRLASPTSRLAVRIDGASWSYDALTAATHAHVTKLEEAGIVRGDRVGVFAASSLSTVAAILGNLSRGAVTVGLSPKLGPRELIHILSDASPKLVFADSDHQVPDTPTGLPLLRERYEGLQVDPCSIPIPVDGDAALVLYTSGTTGAPKGVVITRRNIAENLDALSATWAWTESDTVVHALPLIHVHGLVLGLFGSLRVGGALHHVSRFSPGAMAEALTDPSRRGSTVLFAVPTMYHRLAEAAETDARIATALSEPRLLISGSAGLPLREHERIRAITGRGVHERYGLTETLINCAVPAAAPPMPGYVGSPLPGVELRLVDEQRNAIDANDDSTIGEVAVRSTSVFAGYLNQPDATRAVLDEDGWFYTGDLATRTTTGAIRILGRRSTDLIKTGGYRVGAGEIEACLLEHPACAEVAVVGMPDDDLGQRIVAFVVLRDGQPDDTAPLMDHASTQLSRHKQPREVRFVDELPRNAMGKVQKKRLLPSP